MNGDYMRKQEAIEHWRRMRNAESTNDLNGERPSAAHCSFCQFYLRFDNISAGACEGCPVAVATGTAGCEHTPYPNAADAFERWERSEENNFPPEHVLWERSEWRKMADLELAFLESLVISED